MPFTPLDISTHHRINLTLEMLREVSRQDDPNLAAASFGTRYWQLFPLHHYLSASIRGLQPGEYKITRSVPVVNLQDPDIRRVARENPWRDWATNPIRRGGWLGEVIARGTPQLFHNLRITDDPVLGNSLADMGSCVAAPLFDAGEPLNWAFTFHRDPERYTERDLEESLMISNLFGATTRNRVSIAEIQTLNARLTAQFEEVARVQQSLLPKQHPHVPGLRIATSYLPSDIAGGDYYDFFPLPDGRLGILIADASGHGVGAATVMAMLHAILHSYPQLDRGPARVLEWANNRLLDAGMEGAFVTALFAIYNPADRTLTWSRAGHPLARLKDGLTGRVTALDGAAALPLGLAPHPMEEASVRLKTGDTVVLYTDGITEAFGGSGQDKRTMFGVAGLDQALEVCTGDPDCVVDTVHAALHRHTGSLTRADDQTLVVFRVIEA